MEKLLIAKVSKPQGIKGELKCQLYTDVFSAVEQMTEVFVGQEKCEVEYAKLRRGDLYLKLRGVDDRNHAELFRNCEIFLPKEEISKFVEDDFLVDDLIGMVLYDEDGNLVGQIVDYEDYGSAPILSIEQNGHVYELPYIKEIFKTEGETLVVIRNKFEENKI